MAAAEAGVADYLYRLNNDSAYWTKCTAAGPGLNDPWTGTTPPSGTNWRTVPGATTRYAIELLPARNSGYTKCDPADDKVVDSMLDPADPQPADPGHGRGEGLQGPRAPQRDRERPPDELPGLPLVHRLRDLRPRLVAADRGRPHDGRHRARSATCRRGAPTTARATTARRRPVRARRATTGRTRTGRAGSTSMTTAGSTTASRSPASRARTRTSSSPRTTRCSARCTRTTSS